MAGAIADGGGLHGPPSAGPLSAYCPACAGTPGAVRWLLGRLAQGGQVVHVGQPVQGRGLQALGLAGADAQLALHLGTRAGLAGGPEPQLDDLALVIGQALERLRDASR